MGIPIAHSSVASMRASLVYSHFFDNLITAFKFAKSNFFLFIFMYVTFSHAQTIVPVITEMGKSN